jgi:hypothetical protein
MNSPADVTFEEARRLLQIYFERNPKLSVRGTQHYIEARERLRQLDFILDRMNALDAEYADLATRSVDEAVGDDSAFGPVRSRQFSMGDDYAFFAEGFYLFAWRVRQCLRKLPELKRFECKIVRDLRNQFIEHPEMLEGVTGRGISFGNALGPQLSIARVDDRGATLRDPGLYANAATLRDAVIRGLKRASPGETKLNPLK